MGAIIRTGDSISLGEQSVRHALEKANSRVYGVLLDGEGSTVSNLVKERWVEFDKMLKRQSNYVTFGFLESPLQLPDYYVKRWSARLGVGESELTDFVNLWTRPREQGDEFQYLKEFGLESQAKAIPCLVLFTKLDSNEAAIRQIPEWKENDLWDFFVAVVDNLYDCSEKQPDDADARLKCIKQSLTSRWAILGMGAKHFGKAGQRFIRENPTYIIDTFAGMIGGVVKHSVRLQ
jgi:hypothetical protein